MAIDSIVALLGSGGFARRFALDLAVRIDEQAAVDRAVVERNPVQRLRLCSALSAHAKVFRVNLLAFGSQLGSLDRNINRISHRC
mgnify:CR=1 FL=1